MVKSCCIKAQSLLATAYLIMHPQSLLSCKKLLYEKQKKFVQMSRLFIIGLTVQHHNTGTRLYLALLTTTKHSLSSLHRGIISKLATAKVLVMVLVALQSEWRTKLPNEISRFSPQRIFIRGQVQHKPSSTMSSSARISVRRSMHN